MSTARRPDASMSLLVDITADSLDPAYAAASHRPASLPSSARHIAVLVGLLLTLGTLVGVAVSQTRDRPPAAAQARRALAAELQTRTARNDALETRLRRLRVALARSRNDSLALTSAGVALQNRLAALEPATGAVSVTGPGLRVLLDDAPAGRAAGAGGPRTGTARDPGRVVDRDLQEVTNTLWSAGAEAVAINGARLTSQSAIREAGDAILVDFRPLPPPYHVSAIGDPDRLPARFAASVTTRRFRTYAATYGMRFEPRPRATLRLPAAAALLLRRAGPVTEPAK